MSGGGGKGGSNTSAQSIPDWVQGPAQDNLAKAKLAGEIGYMPYYGPEVAGLSPMQTQGMQRTQDALSAYGLAPQGSQYQSSLPEQTSMGGVSGYGSGNLFDAAVAELGRRNPEMAARYASAMAPVVRPPPPPVQAPVGILGNVGGGDGFDGGGRYTDGGNGVGVNGGPIGSGGGNAAGGYSYGGW
jgi:hypothetical protein